MRLIYLITKAKKTPNHKLHSAILKTINNLPHARFYNHEEILNKMKHFSSVAKFRLREMF